MNKDIYQFVADDRNAHSRSTDGTKAKGQDARVGFQRDSRQESREGQRPASQEKQAHKSILTLKKDQARSMSNFQKFMNSNPSMTISKSVSDLRPSSAEKSSPSILGPSKTHKEVRFQIPKLTTKHQKEFVKSNLKIPKRAPPKKQKPAADHGVIESVIKKKGKALEDPPQAKSLATSQSLNSSHPGLAAIKERVTGDSSKLGTSTKDLLAAQVLYSASGKTTTLPGVASPGQSAEAFVMLKNKTLQNLRVSKLLKDAQSDQEIVDIPVQAAFNFVNDRPRVCGSLQKRKELGKIHEDQAAHLTRLRGRMSQSALGSHRLKLKTVDEFKKIKLNGRQNSLAKAEDRMKEENEKRVKAHIEQQTSSLKQKVGASISTHKIIQDILGDKESKPANPGVPSFTEKELGLDLKDFKYKSMRRFLAYNQDNANDPAQLAMFNYFEQEDSGLNSSMASFRENQNFLRDLFKKIEETDDAAVEKQLQQAIKKFANVFDFDESGNPNIQIEEQAKKKEAEAIQTTEAELKGPDTIQGTGLRISQERLQGKILLNWLKAKTDLVEQLPSTDRVPEFIGSIDLKSKSEASLKAGIEKISNGRCEDTIRLADVCLDEVTKYYAKKKCSEWAQILTEIKGLYNSSYQQIIKRLLLKGEEDRLDFDRRVKWLDDKHSKTTVEIMKEREQLQIENEQLKVDLEYEKQAKTVLELRQDTHVDEVDKLKKRVEEEVLKQMKQYDEIQALQLKNRQFMNKKQFLNDQLQKQVQLLTVATDEKKNLEMQLKRLDESSDEDYYYEQDMNTSERQLHKRRRERLKRKRNPDNDMDMESLSISQESRAMGDGDFYDPLGVRNQKSEDLVKSAVEDYELNRFIKNNDKHFVQAGKDMQDVLDIKRQEKRDVLSVDSKQFLYSSSDSERGKPMNAIVVKVEGGGRTYSQPPARSLENKDMIRTEMKGLPADAFKSAMEGIVDADYIKQSEFVQQFMTEVNINTYFHRIQKQVQEIVNNDDFILRLILNGALNRNDKTLAFKYQKRDTMKGASASKNADLEFRQDQGSPIFRKIQFKHDLPSGRQISPRIRGNKRLMRPESRTPSKFSPSKLSPPPRRQSKLGRTREFSPREISSPASPSRNVKIDTLKLDRWSRIKAKEMLENQAMFFLRTESLFDIIYTVLSKTLLHQTADVFFLIRDLKKRFGREWSIDSDYNQFLEIQEAVQALIAREDGLAKANADLKQGSDIEPPTGELQFAKIGVDTLPPSKKQSLRLPADRSESEQELEPPKQIGVDVSKESKATQTGDTLEEMIHLCSIYSADVRPLALPGESSLIETLMRQKEVSSSEEIQRKLFEQEAPGRYVSLNYMDTINKKLLKVKISSKKKVNGDSKEEEEKSRRGKRRDGTRNLPFFRKHMGELTIAPSEQATFMIDLEVEEYLPRNIVETMLPFECLFERSLALNKANLMEPLAYSSQKKKEAQIQRVSTQRSIKRNISFADAININANQPQSAVKRQQHALGPEEMMTPAIQEQASVVSLAFNQQQQSSAQPRYEDYSSMKRLLQTQTLSVPQSLKIKIQQMKFSDRKLVANALGLQHNNRDAQDILSEYHRYLKEATEKYPTRMLNLAFLKMQAESNNKKVKNSFSLLPPQHQIIIYQVIDQTIQSKLQGQALLAREKEVRQQMLLEHELELERLNHKAKMLMGHIQDLETRKIILENGEIFKHYNYMLDNNARYSIEFQKGRLLMNQIYSDGFKMGLMHGKFLGSQIQENLFIAKGQENGVKHGWLSGFEAGQVNGIKKVFIEAYLNNINLFERIQQRQKGCVTVLDQISMVDLKRERLNEFYKQFNQVKVMKSKLYKFREIVLNFKMLPTEEKLKLRKIGKIMLYKHIIQIYQDYMVQKVALDDSKDPRLAEKVPEDLSERVKHANDEHSEIYLFDAIFGQISLNYGNMDLTQMRLFRLFSSALFSSFGHDQRLHMDKNLFDDQILQNYLSSQPKDRLNLDAKAEIEQAFRTSRINYTAIHFAKFCQLSDSMNNLSHEVFRFYIEVLMMLRDPKILGPQQKQLEGGIEVLNRIQISHDEIIDVVIQWRVHQVLNKHFLKMVPSNVFNAFRKLVESSLRVVEERRRSLKWVDMEKFMDHSILLYLRFNRIQEEHPLKKIYLACTLFSIDYLEFDQVYLLLKILMPTQKQMVSFVFDSQKQIIIKKIKDIMVNVHSKFSVASSKSNSEDIHLKAEMEKMMAAVSGFDSSAFFEEDSCVDSSVELLQNPNSTTYEMENFQRVINKINTERVDFKAKANCFVNMEAFFNLFVRSDIYRTQRAQAILSQFDKQKKAALENALVNQDFINECYRRLEALKEKLEKIGEYAKKIKRFNDQLVIARKKREKQANLFTKSRVVQKFEEDLINIESQVAKKKIDKQTGKILDDVTYAWQKKKDQNRQSPASSLKRQDDSDNKPFEDEIESDIFSDDLSDSFEFEINDLKIFRQRKKRREKTDDDLIIDLSMDIKPYFSNKTIKTWESRLRRIEMKMTVLAPDLVALSLSIHEESLSILLRKLEKFHSCEEDYLEAKIKREKMLASIRADAIHMQQQDEEDEQIPVGEVGEVQAMRSQTTKTLLKQLNMERLQKNQA